MAYLVVSYITLLGFFYHFSCTLEHGQRHLGLDLVKYLLLRYRYCVRKSGFRRTFHSPAPYARTIVSGVGPGDKLPT